MTYVKPTINSPNVENSYIVSESVGIRTFQATFTDTPNEKVDLYWTTPSTVTFRGIMDVILVGQLGAIQKRFALSISDQGVISSNANRYTDVVAEPATHMAIGDLTWDSTNDRWRIKIYNRTGTTRSINVVVTAYDNSKNIDVILPSFGLSNNYSNDLEIAAEPLVWFDRLFIAQGAVSNFKTTPAGSTTDILLSDSVILAGSGSFVRLPSASQAGKGRSFIVKNVGTSGVTVTAISGQIDAATSMTIGNRSFATFMSDAVDWWRVS